MASPTRYEVNAPAVAGEVIDGEAIILHLPLGHYFSSEGSGALIWAGIERRMLLSDIACALADRFAIDGPTANGAVADFVAELARHQLVRPAADPSDHPLADDDLPGEGAYAPPRIDIYTDMQHLLLLDPIHDVDATGWPVAPDRIVA